MWNAQRQRQKEAVDAYRNRPDAWLNLPVAGPLAGRALSFEIKDLSFLLEGNASTLQEVIIEEHRFSLATYIIDRHQTIMLSEVFPRLSRAGMRIGDQAAIQTVEQLLGAGIVQQLRVLTAGIIKNVDENVRSSFAVFRKLRESLKRVYPNRKFIDLHPFE